MNKLTTQEILEHIDIIIDHLTYHDTCYSALDIAIQLKEEIEYSLDQYNDD